MSTLSLRKIDKIYDNNVQAVFDFNLDIKDKEFIVLVGPSGCGKSTTLRMVAGLEDITNGELYIDNKFVNTVMPKDRDIAMVFQNYALYPHMTVYKNMAFGLTIRKHPIPVLDEKGNKIPVNDVESIENLKKQVKKLNNEDGDHKEEIANLEKQIKYLEDNKTVFKVKMVKYTNEEIDKAVRHAADILGLTKYLNRKPAALSGGQRQRVALGRAIVRQPKVFLMDEPLSNLDAKLRVQMRSEITRIHQRVGATTIYVTHDQTEAMTMADRIVIMKDGWVQQIGSPDDVYNDPENIFVAGFIGSPAMNFYRGRYEGGYFYFDGGKNIKLKLAKDQVDMLKPFNNKNVTLGVRPNDIYVKGDKANKSPSSPVDLTCEIKELLGDEIIVYGDISNQRTAIKLKAGKANVEQGKKLSYCFDSNKMYFFEQETELRIRKGSKPTPADKLPKKEVKQVEEAPKKEKKNIFARIKSKFKKKKQ